jgi:hypothetical protein
MRCVGSSYELKVKTLRNNSGEFNSSGNCKLPRVVFANFGMPMLDVAVQCLCLL